VLRFARDLSPRWVVIENVVQMRAWDGYPDLLDALKGLGYFVRQEILDSAAFGVPQTRRRLFLICDRERPPSPLQIPKVSEASAKEVLEPADTHASRPLYSDRRARGTLERAERAIAALGTGVPFLIVYYGSDGAGGWQTLDRQLRTMTTLDRFGLVTWDGQTPMLRMLQVAELRRAMGFGSGYLLGQGTRRDQIKLLGNGVCPPVMRGIVEGLSGRARALSTTEVLSPERYPVAAE
jgi:DNA (cytosine-5)-methyltransferase 1